MEVDSVRGASVVFVQTLVKLLKKLFWRGEAKVLTIGLSATGVIGTATIMLSMTNIVVWVFGLGASISMLAAFFYIFYYHGRERDDVDNPAQFAFVAVYMITSGAVVGAFVFFFLTSYVAAALGVAQIYVLGVAVLAISVLLVALT